MPTEPTKLRWYAPLWKDPLGWARWGGNSGTHLVCAIIFHLVLWGLWVFGLFAFASVQSLGGSGLLSPLPLLFLLGVAFFASVLIPAAYLYALYRLIGIIDEKSKKA